MSTVWPTLPTVADPVPDLDERRWAYPGVNRYGGAARLRAWSSPAVTGGPMLAVVSELGAGCSVTNAAHWIVAELRDTFGDDVVVLEHYPALQRGDGPTLDQVHVNLDGVARIAWRRIYPDVPDHRPDRGELVEWIHHRGGAYVLEALELVDAAGGAWARCSAVRCTHHHAAERQR